MHDKVAGQQLFWGMLNLAKMLKLVEAEAMVSLEPYLAKVEADQKNTEITQNWTKYPSHLCMRRFLLNTEGRCRGELPDIKMKVECRKTTLLCEQHLVIISWTQERKCLCLGLLNGYTDNNSAMVGTNAGISLHM